MVTVTIQTDYSCWGWNACVSDLFSRDEMGDWISNIKHGFYYLNLAAILMHRLSNWYLDILLGSRWWFRLVYRFSIGRYDQEPISKLMNSAHIRVIFFNRAYSTCSCNFQLQSNKLNIWNRIYIVITCASIPIGKNRNKYIHFSKSSHISIGCHRVSMTIYNRNQKIYLPREFSE